MKETRNDLQTQLDQMIKERGSIVAQAGSAQEKIKELTAQSSDQAKSVSELQSEIARYKTLTETQQATIDEQKAMIEELKKTLEQLQGTSEPNSIEESEGPVTSAPNSNLANRKSRS